VCCLHGSSPCNVLTVTCHPGWKAPNHTPPLEHCALLLRCVVQVSDLKKTINEASGPGKRPVDSQVLVCWGQELQARYCALRSRCHHRSHLLWLSWLFPGRAPLCVPTLECPEADALNNAPRDISCRGFRCPTRMYCQRRNLTRCRSTLQDNEVLSQMTPQPSSVTIMMRDTEPILVSVLPPTVPRQFSNSTHPAFPKGC